MKKMKTLAPQDADDVIFKSTFPQTKLLENVISYFTIMIMCLEIYELDPSRFLTEPGSA